jgi:hypothetical protein
MNHPHHTGMKSVKVENYTGWSPTSWSKIPVLKRKYFAVDHSLESTGDAPKEFIRIYRYEAGKKKSRPCKWPLYIAKTGQKWYPNESITEHLLTRIGQAFSFETADSSLFRISNQLRFLSKHFHSRKEELVHGAEIYYGYMEDKEFIDQIETERRARTFFTLQFTEAAIKRIYPDDFKEIMEKFVEMVLFDAIVGNNDRHFYNWGVIQSIDGSTKPRFSPIYDTARGLLWNTKEEKVVSLHRNKSSWESFRIRYLRESKPKIGWDGVEDLNHFDLLERIQEHGFYSYTLKSKLSIDNKMQALNVLENEFTDLMSPQRLDLVKRLLSDRYDRAKQIIT